MSDVRMPVFMPAEGAPKVAAAIIGVKRDIEKIPKSGRNKEFSYDYVEATVLTAKIQDAMVKHKLVLSPREVSRAVVGTILFVKFEYDAYCEGEAILNIASFSGAARLESKKGTYDDKSASKCLTASLKAIELALFKIPADVDDIERDRDDYHPPGPPDRPPPADPYADRHGGDEPGFTDPPPQDDEPAGEPLDHDARAFRHNLRNANTRDEADRIWLAAGRFLDGCSDQIFELLRDDYQSRWEISPPKHVS